MFGCEERDTREKAKRVQRTKEERNEEQRKETAKVKGGREGLE